MKITIVGTGRVGSAIAFALTLNPLADEVLLVNRSFAKAEGDAMDLRHASALTNSSLQIRAGRVEDAAGSDVIVFTASAPLPDLGKGKSRQDMAMGNMPILNAWVPELAAGSPDAIIIMVTNPVDVMSFLTIELSGFPPERVIGTGTLVDSIRYRALLSEELGIHAEDIRAYILGEHGDSQFAAHSVAMTGGERFYPSDISQRLFEQTVRMGYEVFRRKGHTCYGIALATVTIIDSIAYDLRHTMPVSVLVDGYLGIDDVCLSLPAVIGRRGVTRILHPTLAAEEQDAFRRCADTVRATLASLKGS
ncbi:MAG: lactate/malate dehydrogenase family protein [Planctomycetota bacterium]